MKKYFYAFVIKSIEPVKCRIIGGKTNYFAERTSLQNPRFLTNLHNHVKLFRTKIEAEEYFLKKCRKVHSVGLVNCRVTRKKFFLDKKGKWDYWKNREVLHK